MRSVVFIYVANPVYSTLEEERIAELTTEAAGAPPADVGSGSVEFQAFLASKFKGGLSQAQALIRGDHDHASKNTGVKRTATQAKSVVAQRKRPPPSTSDSSSDDSLHLNDESEDSEL